MRKKLMTLIAVCTLALSACGTSQTSNTPEPTTEPTKAVEATMAPTEALLPTAEPTAAPLPTAEPTATPTPEPTSTPAPVSYGEKNAFVIDNKTEYDLSFIHYVSEWESDEEAEYPGLTTKNEGCKLVLDSVTKSAEEEAGYTTFTVNYHLDYTVKQSVDIREGDSAGPIISLVQLFGVCDYYTGISGINNMADENGKVETVLNWNGEEIKVQISDEKKFDSEWGEWYEESEYICSLLCDHHEEHTLKITVPEGYDGIMLSLSKEGYVGQGKAAVEEAIRETGKTGEVENADNFYFVRLTDVVVDSEPTVAPEPTATPAPTTAPEPTATPAPTEAPVADGEEWETVLRELHSTEGYEIWSDAGRKKLSAFDARKAYIETLDSSVYRMGTIAAEDYFTEGKFDALFHEEAPDKAVMGSRYTRMLATTNVTYSLMTLVNLVTGETDVWGVEYTTYYDENLEEWNEDYTDAITIENATWWYNQTDNFRAQYGMITTWETLHYYIDLFNPADAV